MLHNSYQHWPHLAYIIDGPNHCQIETPLISWHGTYGYIDNYYEFKKLVRNWYQYYQIHHHSIVKYQRAKQLYQYVYGQENEMQL